MKNPKEITLKEEEQACPNCNEIYFLEHDCPNEIKADIPTEPNNCYDDTIYCEPICPKCGRDIDKCNEECEKHEEPDPEEEPEEEEN